MNPVLLNIYGPLSIHIYGVCMALGVVSALWLIRKEQRMLALMKFEDFIASVQYLVLAGYLGGRLICILSEDKPLQHLDALLKFWEPGFSVVGSLLGILIFIAAYLRLKKISVLKYFDAIAIYAPLVEGFARLGCFFTGCCYGTPTTSCWCVVYTHSNNVAPLHTPLHPTQLYLSISFFVMFLFFYTYARHRMRIAGTLIMLYLTLATFNRFLIDFIRDDKVFFNHPSLQMFTMYQWISLAMCISAATGLLFIRLQKKNHGSI